MEADDSHSSDKEHSSSPKKLKQFCAKEFRKKLASPENQQALEQFVDICRGDDCSVHVLEYLENGGSCLELFQLLESTSGVPASLVVESANHVLLQIVSNYAHFYRTTEEACRYFLKAHMALINKMVSLAASSNERRVILKLLTVIVTLSSSLAKEVLMRINFNDANLEVLTKHTEGNSGVRSAFIHFLMAFLIEGKYPVISILLKKKGLLTSIIRGLQYDPSETVCIVMMTLTKNIVENPLFSKTTKMSVFNTIVIKEIVNLYNWKGPMGSSTKKKPQGAVVSESDKMCVNEAVHELLLMLCTSYRLGLIFGDPQLGLGRETPNSLMYTVLQSLERPWEHSYAGELVTKICGACPDLVKTVWFNLNPSLEPRLSASWLKAVKFAKVLVNELEPAAIDFCARDLSVMQLAQVVQFLTAPTPILKTLVPENQVFETPSTKHHVLSVLAEFLKAVQKYLIAVEEWKKPQDAHTLKMCLSDHIVRNFPSAQNVLADWTKPDDNVGAPSFGERLEVMFDVLELYESICPQLLETLSSINTESFLKEIKELVDGSPTFLQIRAATLFFNFEPATFAPKGELFAFAFPLILGHYFESKNESACRLLSSLLRNTGIFECCSEEAELWVNTVFDLNALDAGVSQILVEIIRETSDNMFDYLSAMSELRENSELEVEQHNFQDILENLCRDTLQGLSSLLVVKHRGLSPLLFGSLEYFQKVEQTKSFKNYLSHTLINLLHFQTSPRLITAIVSCEKYQGLISKHVLSYIKGWSNSNLSVLTKTKAHLTEKFSVSFLEGDVDEFFENHQQKIETCPGQTPKCLDQALFYFTNMSSESVMPLHLTNCLKVVKFLFSQQKPYDVAERIFGNPVLLQRFIPSSLGKDSIQGLSTRFLVDVVKEFQSADLQKALEGYMKPFRSKVETLLRRVLKRAGKKSVKITGLLEILEVFNLEHQQCREILRCCSELQAGDLDPSLLFFYYTIVIQTLKRYISRLTELEPLDNQVVSTITQLLTFLNRKSDPFDASACSAIFMNYLQIFPHNLEDVNCELFESLLLKSEFCVENALLASFLLSRRSDFLDIFVKNIPTVASKKGLILPLLEAAIRIHANEEILKSAYENFEPSILKGLQKPGKAGQHFERYPNVLAHLITNFMPEDVCQMYVKKVHKFDTIEPFHVQMLTSVFTKAIFHGKGEVSESYLNNSILMLVYATNALFKKKSAGDDDGDGISKKLDAVVQLTHSFFQKVGDCELASQVSFRPLCENDGFHLYCKFCLKFGLSGDITLMKVLKSLVQLVNFEESEAQLLLEMAASHSEFLECMLNEDSGCKMELLDLLLILFRRWPSVMQRNHVPVLLAAYQATTSRADRIILTLLQMYEKEADKTHFYDFKPFLWGTAAATHYSVRQDIQQALWRQPKMHNILDILQENWVRNTILHYPLDSGLIASHTASAQYQQNIYDLAFFLPLFGSLLAPENEVATHKFAQSGGLSLTVIGLSSSNKELRMAAYHVLARLHYHIEAKHDRKDRLLWLRYIEALCMGTATMRHFRVNNFTAIFWANMALVLTQPFSVFYVPLCRYLTAKQVPKLGVVPELYTFLHNPDVNSKETRTFVLELLRDGLRTNADVTVAINSAAFKLILELFSSCVADLDTKVLVLAVVERACRLQLGKKILCMNCGLLALLFEVVAHLSCVDAALLCPVVRILAAVTENVKDCKFVNCDLVGLIVESIVDKGLVSGLHEQDLECFVRVVLEVFRENVQFLTEKRLRTIVSVAGNKQYEYLLKYGCKFFVNGEHNSDIDGLVQLLVIQWLNKR